MSPLVAISLAIVSIMLIGCPGLFTGPETSSEKELTSFGFSDPLAEGIIDESTNSISIVVPMATDLNSAIIANFSTTGEIVKVGTKRQISGSTPNIFSSPVLYKVEAEDGTEKTYTVRVSHLNDSSKTITAFQFDSLGADGYIDEAGHSISLSVPFGTDVTALVASFSTTGIRVSVGGIVQESGHTGNDFTREVVYVVTAEDGSSADYKVVVNIRKSDEKKILYFGFSDPHVVGTIDESNHSITLEVPDGTVVTALTAAFSIAGARVSVGEVVQKSSTTYNDFTVPVYYMVTADDGSKQEYSVTVTVDVLPPSTGYYGSPTASRTTGVAPLYVHFSADFTGDPAAARGFRDFEYSWNFGDPASGYWGTNGASRNLAKGGVAAHVYEKPGTYTVSLFVRDSWGKLGQNFFTIKVDDPDQYYAGNKTVCVSDVASNDFTGAPPGALLVATDDLASITGYATAGSRILFRRGSSWNTGGLSWPENGGPVTIGAFGAGIGVDGLGNY